MREDPALAIDNAANQTEIFLGKQNNMTSVENCPFVKGEKVGICSITDPLQECRFDADGSSKLSRNY